MGWSCVVDFEEQPPMKVLIGEEDLKRAGQPGRVGAIVEMNGYTYRLVNRCWCQNYYMAVWPD